MPRLLDHAYELALLLDWIEEENGGEVDDEAIRRLGELEMGLMDRADAVAGLAREYRLRAEAAKAEEQRYARRRASAEAASERLNGYVKESMEVAGYKRLSTERFQLTVARNGQPSIRWAGPGPIPEEFATRTVTVSIDRDKVRAALAGPEGALPEGFEVITGTHLRIR